MKKAVLKSKMITIGLMALAGSMSAQWPTSPSNINNIYNPNAGNVGIGTASPAYKLHVLGDVGVDGNVRVGQYLKLNNNQLCLETNADLYINNAALGNGNVWIGKPNQGLVSVMNNFHTSGSIISDYFMRVGTTLKITNNQICVEDQNTPLYVNGAALGNGNVIMGKPGTGAISVLNEFNVSNNGILNFKVLNSGQTTISTGATDAFIVQDNSVGGNPINFKVKKNGFVYAREINVQTSTFPDYVFAKNYKLQTLNEVENYIKANKHLPGFNNAEYYIENGINSSEMFVKQQEKIEELTLYVIELQKRLEKLEQK